MKHYVFTILLLTLYATTCCEVANGETLLDFPYHTTLLNSFCEDLNNKNEGSQYSEKQNDVVRNESDSSIRLTARVSLGYGSRISEDQLESTLNGVVQKQSSIMHLSGNLSLILNYKKVGVGVGYAQIPCRSWERDSTKYREDSMPLEALVQFNWDICSFRSGKLNISISPTLGVGYSYGNVEWFDDHDNKWYRIYECGGISYSIGSTFDLVLKTKGKANWLFFLEYRHSHYKDEMDLLTNAGTFAAFPDPVEVNYSYNYVALGIGISVR